MQQFSFSITSGYNTLDNIAILNTNISSIISIPIISINPYGDAIEITFESSLTTEQTSQLQSIVEQWDINVPVNYNKIITIPFNKTKINDVYYRLRGTYGYDGEDVLGSIKKITFIAYMDPNVTSYSIKIYDVTNAKIMAECVFTNIDHKMIDVGELNYPEETPCILEFQIKKTGGTVNDYVYINNASIYL